MGYSGHSVHQRYQGYQEVSIRVITDIRLLLSLTILRLRVLFHDDMTTRDDDARSDDVVYSGSTVWVYGDMHDAL